MDTLCKSRLVPEFHREGECFKTTPCSCLSEDFFLFKYKIEDCVVKTAHDWKLCPFLHPNEKARRRDLRIHYYEGILCTNYRKERKCKNGDQCRFAHGTFEYWLHPSNFRTQMCTSGAFCQRKFCFFSHSVEEFMVSQSKSRLLEGFEGSVSEASRRCPVRALDAMEYMNFVEKLLDCSNFFPVNYFLYRQELLTIHKQLALSNQRNWANGRCERKMNLNSVPLNGLSPFEDETLMGMHNFKDMLLLLPAENAKTVNKVVSANSSFDYKAQALLNEYTLF